MLRAFFQIPEPTHNMCWESPSTVVKLILKGCIIYLNQLKAFLITYLGSNPSDFTASYVDYNR